MRSSYEPYREAEQLATLLTGADRLRVPRSREVGRLVDRAVRSSASGIVITDATAPDNPIVYANPAFTEMTGLSEEEAVGENCRILQGEDRDQPALDELRAAVEEGQECRVVLRNYRKCGALFWNELYVSPVRDAEGRLTHFVGVQNDVTERREAEEALRRSEDRLRLAVEATGLGTWDFDLAAGTLRWDERCKAMFGLPPRAEVDYEVFLEGLHPGDRERVEGVVRRALEPGGGGRFEVEYRTVGIEDGVERWVEARGQAFFDEAGRAARFTGTVLDVTGRRRVEEALRKAEEEYRSIFENAVDGIFRTSLDGRLLAANPAMARMFGYGSPEEMMEVVRDAGRQLHVDPEQRAEFARRLRREGTVAGFEAEGRCKDGCVIWVSANARLLRDPGSGEVIGFEGTMEDITERKRAEEAQRFLMEAGAVLSSSLDYEATLARVARLAVPQIADWCAVDVVGDDGGVRRLAVAHKEEQKIALAYELDLRYPPDPEAPYGVPKVLSTGEPELVPEVSEELLDGAAVDAEHRRLLRGLGLSSYLVVPLVAGGRTLGAITLARAEPGRRYGPDELELAGELARRAALAVENARLYKARGETARALQGGLLPSRLPEVPGIEVGLRYLPAGEAQVGGDFYDLFDARIKGRAGDRNEGDIGSAGGAGSAWGAVIGDVCGKGAEAAAMLALARYTIRAAAMHEACPSAILADLNEAVLRQRRERDDHKFCTVAYLRLETHDGSDGSASGARVTVCRGGHPAPVLLGADGCTRRVGDPGRVIGVFDDAGLSEEEVRLKPGDALVLYTDGVVEARSPDGSFYGEERLFALLRASAGLDASTIAGRVESAVLCFQEHDLRDDVAVLVLKAL